jgi:hypothetical protein
MQLPQKVLHNLACSFGETLPGNFNAFLVKLRSYGESIGVPAGESEFAVQLPVSAVDIEYE